MPATVVLDTNALLLPFERRIRIESEIERLVGPFQGVVPEPCLRELERLMRDASGARRDRAKMARQFAQRFLAAASELRADEATVEIARERGAYVFSNDRDVVKRAHAAGLRVVRLKGLSHLFLDTSHGPED